MLQLAVTFKFKNCRRRFTSVAFRNQLSFFGVHSTCAHGKEL